MASKYTITYRCGHQRQDFIHTAEEYVPDILAEFARTLCSSCQLAREQQQFEEAIQQANRVYNITDQNGCLITVTLTRPGFCQITMQYDGDAPFYEKELEIAQVTPELHRQCCKDLYWSDKDWSKQYKRLQ